MKKLALVIVIAIFGLNVKAQDYDLAGGLRFGLGTGVTLKTSIGGDAMLEGILSFRSYGFEITGLYEVHNANVFGTPRLNWYYGGGAHIGSYRGYRSNPKTDIEYTTKLSLGIDGILGIEYNFTEIPLNLSLDWKPQINLISNNGFWGDNGALSARYMF